jgi:predicted RNA-binding Zn-ribbon protein involved in translation (DUF1610 family)
MSDSIQEELECRIGRTMTGKRFQTIHKCPKCGLNQIWYQDEHEPSYYYCKNCDFLEHDEKFEKRLKKAKKQKEKGNICERHGWKVIAAGKCVKCYREDRQAKKEGKNMATSGSCSICKAVGPLLKGMCRSCYYKEYDKRRRQDRHNKGICKACGRERPIKNKGLCGACDNMTRIKFKGDVDKTIAWRKDNPIGSAKKAKKIEPYHIVNAVPSGKRDPKASDLIPLSKPKMILEVEELIIVAKTITIKSTQ